MKADAHRHFGCWGRNEVCDRLIDPFPGTELSDASAIISYIRRKDLSLMVLVPTYSPDAERTFALNASLLECANCAPDVVVPGFWVDPSPNVRNMLEETLELARANHVKVLKMSASAWPDDYSLDPDTWNAEVEHGLNAVLEYAAEERCVLQIHTGGHKSDIRFAEKFIRHAPKGPVFHLVHMGARTNAHFYFVPRFADWLAESLDVVCDTSLAVGFAVRWIASVAKENDAVARRIMFASDEPWGVFEAELAKIVDAVGTEEQLLRRMLFENACSIYGSRRLPK